MSDFGDIFKKNWDAGIALVGFISSALLTFRSMIDMPFEVRLFLVGMFGSVMVGLVVVTLTRSPTRGSAGFKSRETSKPWGSGFAKAVKIVLILLLCVLAVFLLRVTVTYHAIRLSQHPDTDPLAGIIEVQPSHFSANVTLALSTRQPVQILDWNFKNCKDGDDPVSTPNIENESAFGVTIHLFKFQTSQEFCIFYRLSDRAERLAVNATVDGSNIEILRDDRVRACQRSISLYFGGTLCLFAIVFFSYRCSWFRKPNN